VRRLSVTARNRVVLFVIPKSTLGSFRVPVIFSVTMISPTAAATKRSDRVSFSSPGTRDDFSAGLRKSSRELMLPVASKR